MRYKKPSPLDLALKKPYASEPCIAIAKVLSDGSERSQDEIGKLTELRERDVVSGLINLEKRAKVVMSRPLIKSDYVKKGEEVLVVYKFRPKYLQELQKKQDKYLA